MFNPALVAFLAAEMLSWTKAPAEAKPRFEAIAESALEVAFIEEDPPLVDGPSGRVETAMLLLGISSYESIGFHKGVEDGRLRGDGGRSWCLAQVNIGPGQIVVLPGGRFKYATAGGWSGADLVKDRRKCFRAASAIARESIRSCGDLSGYTTGRCMRGEREASLRLSRARALAKKAWWLDDEAR